MVRECFLTSGHAFPDADGSQLIMFPYRLCRDDREFAGLRWLAEKNDKRAEEVAKAQLLLAHDDRGSEHTSSSPAPSTISGGNEPSIRSEIDSISKLTLL